MTENIIPDDRKLTIQVINGEGEVAFEKTVEWKDIKYCRTIGNMLEGLGAADEDGEVKFPLMYDNVKDEKYLDLLIEYTHFMATPDYPKDTRTEDQKIDDELTEWENKYIEKMDKNTITQLILLANYLEFNFLLEPLCKSVAGMVKEKTPEEVREEWGIKNDLSKEEEEKIRKENQFIEEALERN